MEDQTRQLLVNIKKESIIIIGILITLIIISIIITLHGHRRMGYIEKHLKEHGPKTKTKKEPLVNFIEKTLKRGISEKEIRLALSKNGWKDKMVNDAFKKIKSSNIVKEKK